VLTLEVPDDEVLAVEGEADLRGKDYFLLPLGSIGGEAAS